MAKSAKVESLDALKELRTFLCSLASKVTLAIEDAEYDLQNTLNWLKQDQAFYWKHQLQKRREEYQRAKSELKRKQYLDKPTVGGNYSHIDEKKALALAQQRYEQTEDKLQKVHSWIPQLEKQMHECRVALQGLANLVQIDLPKKRTEIDRMIIALESYMGVRMPEFEVPAGMAAAEEGGDMSRPAEQTEEESSGDLSDLYQQLRHRSELLRDRIPEIPFKKSEIRFFAIPDDDPALEVIAKHKLQGRKIDENATVVVDDSVRTSNCIFAGKPAPGKAEKASVCIGPVESVQTANHSAYPLNDFLRWNPTWPDLFSLPAGWIILLKDGQIADIFNADGNRMYTTNDNSG